MLSMSDHINLDTALLPCELMLKDILDPTRPSWLVQLLRVHVTTTCDICKGRLDARDYAYYEQSHAHPAHTRCWVLTLPDRPVRVVTVRYRR